MLLFSYLSLTGAGIYAETSQYSNNVPLSNNDAIVWRQHSSTYYSLYCMSNASSTSAYVLYPYSSRYVSTTTCGAGCYRLYYSGSQTSLDSTYQGIHTCRIQDSRGIYLDVHVGIYPNGFHCKLNKCTTKRLPPLGSIVNYSTHSWWIMGSFLHVSSRSG